MPKPPLLACCAGVEGAAAAGALLLLGLGAAAACVQKLRQNLHDELKRRISGFGMKLGLGFKVLPAFRFWLQGICSLQVGVGMNCKVA